MRVKIRPFSPAWFIGCALAAYVICKLFVWYFTGVAYAY